SRAREAAYRALSLERAVDRLIGIGLADDQFAGGVRGAEKSALADAVHRHFGPGSERLAGIELAGRRPPVAAIKVVEDADAAHAVQRIPLDGSFDLGRQIPINGRLWREFTNQLIHGSPHRSNAARGARFRLSADSRARRR